MFFVGVSDVSDSTNVFMAKAFKELGIEVIPINYRTIIQTYGKEVFYSALINTVRVLTPDFILFSKCNGIDSMIVGECGKYCKTWFWFMDPLRTLLSAPECIEHARMADFVSCTGIYVADYLGSKIGGKIYHIIEGVDLDYYRKVGCDPKYEADVSFIGTASPHRQYCIDVLMKQRVCVRAYGTGFGKYVKGEDFSKICASSKIMLSIDNEIGKGYFSDRILRLGACSSCVLHQYSPLIERYFSEEEVAYFSDASSLVGIV